MYLCVHPSSSNHYTTNLLVAINVIKCYLFSNDIDYFTISMKTYNYACT